MSSIEFGIGLRGFDSVAEDARVAEELGFTYASAGEHVFFHGPINHGLTTLAAAAGATTRLKLLSAITLVPLYPPALLAKQVATLDVVSGGRFSLGVGVGGEYAREFEACGVPVGERGARTDESLEVMRRLWTEDDVRFEGRFTTLPGVTLAPKPRQKPHPPIWISGRSDAAMRRCARFGNGWLPYMYTPEMVAASLEKINAMRADRPGDPPVNAGLFIFFAVHSDRERAVGMANEMLSRQYNQDFSRLVGKYAIAGTPEDCIVRIRQYQEVGVTTIILNPACPLSYSDENQRLLATEVLPAFR